MGREYCGYCGRVGCGNDCQDESLPEPTSAVDLRGATVTDPYLVGYWSRYHGVVLQAHWSDEFDDGWQECDDEMALERLARRREA